MKCIRVQNSMFVTRHWGTASHKERTIYCLEALVPVWRVPFYRYHALHRETEPVMRAHGASIVGIFSRQPEASRMP
ncbi:hypothetical protein K8B33_09915 [Alcanivorax sp. JB21]|uniref:hypothetical protein n=1 Tax=Alcanivorax limicola TaxID=2874102 RepID=UPI001CBE7D2B|nr:hypothetical protein [Alcanivorax limicola]MBZ2189412.1 hypothetical protein [Alcanivorax limicola]